MGCVGSMEGLENKPTPLQIALAFGIAVMIAVQCVGHISGAHINPAVTLAAVIFGSTSLQMAIIYFGAQCLGALTGYGLLMAITPAKLLHDGNEETKYKFCVSDINGELSAGYGVAGEALATGILVFFACGIWDSRNKQNTDSVPIRFGLCIAALCLAFRPYTSCSMNPARSLGPAIITGHWDNHWVYWLGPLLGSAISAVIYRCLFSPDTKDQKDSLRDVGTVNGIEP